MTGISHPLHRRIFDHGAGAMLVDRVSIASNLTQISSR
jgi:hypothetical protein